MLQVSQINKKYGLDPILTNVDFTINATDHYGLVGINSTGKTTLLRIIAGNESADSGRTRYFPQDLRLGYLPQGMIIEDDNTILSYLCNGMDTLDSLEHRLMNLSDSLAQNPDIKKYQDEFDSTMRVDFDEIPHSGRGVLILEDVQVGYENLVLIELAIFILKFGERVALIGENGSGKTSLIKTILGEIPALAGTYRLGSQVRIGYLSQEQNQFDPDKSVFDSISKFMSQNETENRRFLSKFLFKGDDVFKTIGSLSFGERARLSLACLVAKGCNFLILDELINHLDIPSRIQFEKALSEFDGTILAVVHDRFFLMGVQARYGKLKRNSWW